MAKSLYHTSLPLALHCVRQRYVWRQLNSEDFALNCASCEPCDIAYAKDQGESFGSEVSKGILWVVKVTGSLHADTHAVYLIKRYFIVFLSPKIKPCDPTWTWKTVLK